MNDLSLPVIGNLTDDPELRYLPSGVAVAKFRVAHTPRSYNRDTAEWTDGEPREGEKRTVWEIEVDEIGPSLRHATAKVAKMARTSSAGNAPDPWAAATPVGS